MKSKLFLYAILIGLILFFSSCIKNSNLVYHNSNKNILKTIPGNLTSSVYWTDAQQTHNYIVGHLLTPYNSYRADTTTSLYNTAYEWYNASQIYADAEMVSDGDSRYDSYMNNTYTWMNNMWDGSNPNGGYFSAANVDGSGAGGDKYVDDNSITGNTYLDCYNVTIGTTQTAYLNSAEAIANWLMYSGLWDTTYGGGFWWNTQKKVKPTQTNGLALQLFLRLYKITGQSYYKSWANSIINWLNTQMYDSNDGLYIWEIDSTGKQMVKFTYDNGIMVEALLLYYQIMGDNSYLTRAENLANAMHTVLWNTTHKVFIFNTNDLRVNPAWCGWSSQSMIRLYEADSNSNWLNYAQENVDFINSNLRDTTDYGYYQYCDLDGSNLIKNKEGDDQAWMQRVQGLLANYR